jgi:hypothetical protein
VFLFVLFIVMWKCKSILHKARFNLQNPARSLWNPENTHGDTVHYLSSCLQLLAVASKWAKFLYRDPCFDHEIQYLSDLSMRQTDRAELCFTDHHESQMNP